MMASAIWWAKTELLVEKTVLDLTQKSTAKKPKALTAKETPHSFGVRSILVK